MYNRIGPGKVYEYDPESSREIRNIIDSMNYQSRDIMKTYYGMEPRLSVQYTLNTEASLKFGYNRMYQYLHLITNTAAVTPLDIWQSSNSYFKPQIADQLSMGYYRSLHDNGYETFVEVFYKSIENLGF
jgi:hypothetical protein